MQVISTDNFLPAYGTGLVRPGQAGGTTQSFVNNFNFVGPGSTPSLKGHGILHFTITPDGKLTAFPFQMKVTCERVYGIR
jgi:hypothetical protein